MPGALRVGRFPLGRFVGVWKIQQTIALPDLGSHGELPFHDRNHVAAIDRQLGILRQDAVDRATAVVAHFESRVLEPVYQAIEASRGSDGAKNPRYASADCEIGRRLDQRVDQQAEVDRGDLLEHFSNRRQHFVPRQQVDDLSDMHPREVRRAAEGGGHARRIRRAQRDEQLHRGIEVWDRRWLRDQRWSDHAVSSGILWKLDNRPPRFRHHAHRRWCGSVLEQLVLDDAQVQLIESASEPQRERGECEHDE